MNTKRRKPDRKYLRPDARGNGKMVETNLHHCRSRNCRGLVQKKHEHSPYCSRCRRNRFKAKHPLKYSWGNLKRRAKQREKAFSLTFAQYEEFAIKTDYARLKGKSSLSLSIDRKENHIGYHWWNIQAITLRENSRKQYVPYFAKQQENTNYEPTAEELANIERQLQ